MVFLFPGQGAQYQGMALDLWEVSAGVKRLFDLASALCGRDMRGLLAEADGETLKRTDVSQPAITLANLAAAAYLGERGFRPVAAAGFSLGEYAALCAAGLIGEEDCFRLVKARGEAMQASADRLRAEGGDAAPGMAAVLGPSLQNAILALGISSVPGYARLMRASILTVREKEYVEAARAIGARDARIIVKHIIPNAMAPLIVEITMGIGNCILAGAMLSFIGLGVQPPIPEWGAMISEARNVMREHPTHALYPGICVMISVLAFNLLGDGLRDSLDPRLKN